MGQESRSHLLFLLLLAVPERYDERPLLWGGTHPSSKTSDVLSLCLRRLLPLLPMAATLSPACLREAGTLRPVGCTQNFAPPGDALAVPEPRLSCFQVGEEGFVPAGDLPRSYPGTTEERQGCVCANLNTFFILDKKGCCSILAFLEGESGI